MSLEELAHKELVDIKFHLTSKDYCSDINKSKQALKVFNCFAGIGTELLGLKYLDIPFEVVGYSEIDEKAVIAHEALFNTNNNYGDIIKIDRKSFSKDLDLFTYSFPCQDISSAGLGCGFCKDSGTRSSLLWECESLISAGKPKVLLLENVSNILSSEYIDNFKKWLRVLKNLGYSNYLIKMIGTDYGIPQTRRRVFVVSIRNDIDKHFEKPRAFMSYNDLYAYLDSDVINIADKYTAVSCLTRRGKSIQEGNQSRYLLPIEFSRLMGIHDEDFYKIQKVFELENINKNRNYFELFGNAIIVDCLMYIYYELYKNEYNICKLCMHNEYNFT